MEEELKKVLRSMPDYYYDFELGILLLLEDNNEAMADTIDYIKIILMLTLETFLSMLISLWNLYTRMSEEADANEDVQV